MPDDIISEIRNSAAAGLEITAHEQPVNFYGSSQVGYVIIDPSTGAGAYKIGGGENGAFLIAAGISLLIGSIIAVLGSLAATLGSGGTLAPALIALLPFIFTTVSSALAMIARGAEILLQNTTGQALACSIFQGSVATFMGSLLVLYNIVSKIASLFGGAIINYTTNIIAPCL